MFPRPRARGRVLTFIIVFSVGVLLVSAGFFAYSSIETTPVGKTAARSTASVTFGPTSVAKPSDTPDAPSPTATPTAARTLPPFKPSPTATPHSDCYGQSTIGGAAIDELEWANIGDVYQESSGSKINRCALTSPNFQTYLFELQIEKDAHGTYVVNDYCVTNSNWNPGPAPNGVDLGDLSNASLIHTQIDCR